jgi:hypothetical protein
VRLSQLLERLGLDERDSLDPSEGRTPGSRRDVAFVQYIDLGRASRFERCNYLSPRVARARFNNGRNLDIVTTWEGQRNTHTNRLWPDEEIHN